MINILNKYYSNFRHPSGILGRFVVHKMNRGKQHAELAQWALANAGISETDQVLDIGCGGGANVARLLELCPHGEVTGIDFAPVAISIASNYNKEAIAAGRCKIVGGNAKMLPFFKDKFDVATAFETIYYWPALNECLAEVFRVLKPGGRFIIVNDADGIDPTGERWANLIGHMRIYTTNELKTYLADAGFVNITANHDMKSHRISVTGHKPAE